MSFTFVPAAYGVAPGSRAGVVEPHRASGGPWIQEAKLTASDGALGDILGRSVAVSGDTVIVGAHLASVEGNSLQGAAYVFVRSGELWTEQAKLVAADGNEEDFFGVSVAVSDDIALVGASTADVGPGGFEGAVYVYARNGGVWSEQTKLVASDGEPGDAFGREVAMSGNTVIVGAPGVNGFRGAVYVFTRDGDTWTEQAKLTASDGVVEDWFGSAIDIVGDVALVGAQFASVDVPAQGATYVFRREAGVWSEQTKLAASDAAMDDGFGRSVALSDAHALIGAPGADTDGDFDRGAAYLFARDEDQWTELTKLTASDGGVDHAFASSVDLSGDVALLGASGATVGEDPFRGAAYIFSADDGTWNEADKLVALDGAAGDQLGIAVTLAGETAVVSAPRATVDGVLFQGAAYVFADLDLPPNVATLEGTVQSLGRCSAQPGVLQGATVTFIGAQDTYVSETNESGFYRVFLEDGESPVDIVVTAPGHLAAEILDVEFAGGDVVEQDIGLLLDAPCATVAPDGLSVELETGQETSADLIIGNADGAATLSWQITTADPPSGRHVSAGTNAATRSVRAAGSAVGVEVDCEAEPGLVVHDDGTVENGYSGNPSVATQVIFVDRFTPAAYPASFGGVCLAFLTQGPTSLSFEVVVFDDDGPASGPGTELGALTALAEGIPGTPGEPTWLSYDLSALDVTVESGSVFIGARWNPTTPNVFIAADESTDRPVGFAGGYWWNDGTDQWARIENAFTGQYRSLFVRPVEGDRSGCREPGAVPWLSVMPDSGSAPVGGSSAVEVTLSAAALEPGEYSASICVATSDAGRPVIPVPIELTVTGAGESSFIPVELQVDAQALFSDGNGVFEPGEQVEAAPAWRNGGDAPGDLTGTASDFSGPAGAVYMLVHDQADYGSIDPDQVVSCRETGICYRLEVDDPVARPSTHWDAGFEEALDNDTGTTRTWTVHVGDSFADVPTSSLFYHLVENLLHSGVTGGCTPGQYCPAGANSRAQMSVFVLKALEGANYTPPACIEGDAPFVDVPFDHLFCSWIAELHRRGVVAGCGGGNYCPGSPVSRSQMAIFLLKTLEGGGYTPPECAGVFADVPCPSTFGAWIEDLYARGVTGGCSADPLAYCPGESVSRGQMAAFVTRTFGLTLYGP